ncbi:hypothetical protein B0T17DRAFT_50750 [Bombardia bombarda]|uniref:Uncharacterized protein n=1 Tax=Bombardia bombarda TaxID=252184 RepID=A0AA39XMB5_9PEZI|nr:hypothetical protein B0T17DRAFT_50750 [Bombardia bombarda]
MSRSSSIPIVLAPPPTHRVPAADNRQSSHQSNRDSHVTLAPSVYDPGAAARRDKRLPPVPRSPWPLARAPESSTDEDASPPATSGSNTTSSTTRGRNEHRDTLRPPPVPKIFPQHVDGVAHQPRTARSTPALRTGRAPSLTSHPPLHRPTHSNPPPRTNTVRDLTPAEKRSASNPPPLPSHIP